MLFNFIRGGQIFSHNFQMFKQVIHKIITFSLLLTFTIFIIKAQNKIKIYEFNNAISYIKAEHYFKNNKLNKKIKIDTNIFQNKENSTKIIYLTPKEIIENQILKNNKILFLKNVNELTNFVIFTFIFLFLTIILVFFIKGYFLNKDKYLRGARIISVRLLNKFIKKYNRTNKVNKKNKLKKTEELLRIKTKHFDYKIANILFPKGTETLHTMITGASGTGKTVLITDLIEQIRKNGDRAIIYDRMGAFISKFFNGEIIEKTIDNIKNDAEITEERKQELIQYYKLKKDIILNPIDDRSPYWSIFNEVRDGLDFDNIASALIPENASNVDPFWNVAARILFSSVANKLKENNQISNKDLIDKLLKIELEEAAKLVKNTPAQSIIDEQNPKTALSVMAMISANLKSLLHLREQKIFITEKENTDTGEIEKIEQKETPFSIRDWIQNEENENFLFISSRADRHESLKPLISTWLDIAINSLLSLEQSNNRKIWLIIDELPSLYYLPSLHTGLAESRQFGGCFVISMQLMAQLRSIYGKEKAEATSGLCRNRIILNTPDEDTAKWCSDNLGKIEIQEVKENISFGANELRDGVSINKQEIQKNIILPTEIMQLPNLTAFVKFAGDFPIAKSKFKYKNFKQVTSRYIEKEGILEEKTKNINIKINKDVEENKNIIKEEEQDEEKKIKESNNFNKEDFELFD